MRHQKKSKRLGRKVGNRNATLRNMTINLFKYHRIKTTKTKAQLTQGMAERLISLAKQESLHARRQALKTLCNKTAVSGLFATIMPLFKDKNSGFTRIIRYSPRAGDGAEMVFLELTQKPVKKVIPAEKTGEKTKEKQPAEHERPKVAQEKHKLDKEQKPKKLMGNLRKLFKRERDSL